LSFRLVRQIGLPMCNGVSGQSHCVVQSRSSGVTSPLFSSTLMKVPFLAFMPSNSANSSRAFSIRAYPSKIAQRFPQNRLPQRQSAA
jgi:hypothetical protein